jgi:hypothetical protein
LNWTGAAVASVIVEDFRVKQASRATPKSIRRDFFYHFIERGRSKKETRKSFN